MKKRQKWVDHVFPNEIDLGWTDNILGRAMDTEVRLNHYTQGLSDEQLSLKTDQAWSVKEHIGHLADLEVLWQDRFLQFEESLPEIVAADMSNSRTEKASHNQQFLEEILSSFQEKRKQTLSVFRGLSEKAQNHQALHPRLKMIMRPVDLLFFIAEHDDHHLTSIRQLKKNL